MSDLIPPRVRRNNLVTLVLLILFAIGLCAFVLVSMRIHAQRRASNPAATGFIPTQSEVAVPFAFCCSHGTPLPCGQTRWAQTRQRSAVATDGSFPRNGASTESNLSSVA